MMKEVIHFAHGNGFPSRCYRQLFNYLEQQYACFYVDKIGHNPQYPVTENWECLVDELLASVSEHRNNKPVIGVGHSLGGVLTFLAAIREPCLFKAIVMIDSPILNQFKSKLIKLAKVAGSIDRLTPAFRTLARVCHWKTREELVYYLRSKPLFKTFTSECLEDYINYGWLQTEKGYTLVFDKHIEYLIFKTIPHHLYQFKGKLKVPAFLIYGDKSSIVDSFDRRYMKKHYSINLHKMKGSHMLPMEYPKELAEKIIELVGKLLVPQNSSRIVK